MGAWRRAAAARIGPAVRAARPGGGRAGTGPRGGAPPGGGGRAVGRGAWARADGRAQQRGPPGVASVLRATGIRAGEDPARLPETTRSVGLRAVARPRVRERLVLLRRV